MDIFLATEKKEQSNLLWHHAVKNKLYADRMVRYFIEHQIPGINQTDDFDATPLMIAVGLGKKELVTLLLDAGAKLDQTTHEGATALMLAAKNGDAELVCILLAAGARADLQTDQGITALRLAEMNQNQGIVALLKQYLNPSVPAANDSLFFCECRLPGAAASNAEELERWYNKDFQDQDGNKISVLKHDQIQKLDLALFVGELDIPEAEQKHLEVLVKDDLGNLLAQGKVEYWEGKVYSTLELLESISSEASRVLFLVRKVTEI